MYVCVYARACPAGRSRSLLHLKCHGEEKLAKHKRIQAVLAVYVCVYICLYERVAAKEKRAAEGRRVVFDHGGQVLSVLSLA